MNRRDLLMGAAATAAGLGPRTPTRRPSFLWLVAEDMGPTCLGCYGQSAAQTPNLDRLAGHGMRYDRFYTTAPVCSASRSAFMTGMYQTSIGAHHHRSHRGKPFPLPDGVRLLTGWLRDAGYWCGNLVELPDACGFRGTGKTDWNFAPADRPFDFSGWSGMRGGRPFFAQLNLWETHRKFAAPKRIDRAAFALPPIYPEHPVVREDYARYLDAAAELDRKVGLVLAQLEADGLADSTVVLFMGDNGEAHIRGKQFCYEEGLRVPFIVRWPNGLSAPRGYRPGAVERRLTEAIDVAPTLMSLADAPVPARMQGRAFLGPKAAPPRRYAFGARDRCDEAAMRIRTVRDDRYRYIRNFTPEKPFLSPNAYKAAEYPLWTLLPGLNAEGALTPAQAALCAPSMPPEELYDMRADPHQIRNLATDSRHKATMARLRAALEGWITETDDQGRFPEEAGAG
jgi:arylsulfatase A-like enzyme